MAKPSHTSFTDMKASKLASSLIIAEAAASALKNMREAELVRLLSREDDESLINLGKTLRFLYEDLAIAIGKVDLLVSCLSPHDDASTSEAGTKAWLKMSPAQRRALPWRMD